MVIREMVELKGKVDPIDVGKWMKECRFTSYDGFWVDRNGNVYNVNGLGHCRWALDFTGLSACQLENMGWIHVSYGSAFCWQRYMTRPQKDFLELYAIEIRKEYKDFIKNIAEYDDEERLEKVLKIWDEANQLQTV